VLHPALLHGVEPYRVRPADYDGPERWETGTGQFEVMAGVGGAARFMSQQPWNDVRADEAALLARLEDGLRTIPGVTVYGPPNAEGRAPTTIFNVGERAPLEVATELARRRIAVWSGDNYACELIDALGLRARGGVVRAGIVRYTSAGEIDAVLAAVGEIATS
jgi:selenocysteine lyase/cysteine desulfurase